ncbi:adrenodoxin-like protein 2, mitochondrial, partial [Primulina huaijiensis]|uniref:adrenodoxin-like protein 2, mitochondrial n=1 Tax=Primulina huaijiensis TaxID=1492673 RepID=UPI003CC705A3
LKNMFVSRFYRLGSYAVQRLVKAPVFRRPSVLPAIHHQYLQTQAIYGKCGIGYQRDELFSTAAATLDSDEGNETEQKITVTFVDKDGEETNIKVPVGMSMLEAAHENDLDLE